MPTLLVYYLPTTPGGLIDPGDVAAIFPGGAARLLCDSPMFDQAFFLELIDSLLPEEYLRPLKLNANAGYEIFQALAAVAERLAQAAHENECGLVMSYAGNGVRATVPLYFERASAIAGAFVLRAGTLVSASRTNVVFELSEDVAFGALDVSKTGMAIAIAPGYEYNVRGQRMTLGGELLPGEIDTIDVMLQDPPYADASITVRQVSDASGGYPNWLGGHGDNRGLAQGSSEAEDAFRSRLRQLPDTITPNALHRLVGSILDPLGIPWELIEQTSVAYVTCYDAPSPNVGSPSYQAVMPENPLFDTTCLVYDDPRDAHPFRGRYLNTSLQGFFLLVDNSTAVGEYGFALDDPASILPDWLDPDTGFFRGTPALDLPDLTDLPLVAYDGTDVAKSDALAGVYVALNEAKAFGVPFAIDNYHMW